MDIYLPAGKDKANLIFFAMGAVGGFKTNLNKKVEGCNFCPDYFFYQMGG